MAEQIEKFKSEQSLNADRIKHLTSVLEAFSTCCQASSCLPFGNSNNVHMIKVSGYQEPFQVLCNGKSVAGHGWTVIQRRINGTVDFYRNWSEYKQGFGDLNGEFFIGLEKLHHMTTAERQELYIYLEDFDGVSHYAKYDNFIVGTEQESYALKSLGNYDGDVENAMRFNKGQKFSTSDRDNDNDPEVHCAEVFQGAWWYNSCGLSNLNGIYQIADDSYDEEGKGIFWDTEDWHEMDYSLKSVQIMIRPKKPEN
ncbi:GH23025 [Drosophila grimshawi]|uniref:GH23025 n=1 Tax=Drosophila grimshawi TaxID=7222 RepID=B4JWE9_DROGR|nr:GH23025 [Drosophila grimshawi]